MLKFIRISYKNSSIPFTLVDLIYLLFGQVHVELGKNESFILKPRVCVCVCVSLSFSLSLYIYIYIFISLIYLSLSYSLSLSTHSFKTASMSLLCFHFSNTPGLSPQALFLSLSLVFSLLLSLFSYKIRSLLYTSSFLFCAFSPLFTSLPCRVSISSVLSIFFHSCPLVFFTLSFSPLVRYSRFSVFTLWTITFKKFTLFLLHSIFLLNSASVALLSI